jgi:hypothetical protein
MALHPRKIIRLAVVAALKAAETAAQDRVWAGETPPVEVREVLIKEGPVMLVYTRRDRASAGYPATGIGAQKRECDLIVEILAAGGSAVDDKLDDLAEVVEPIVDGFEVPGLPATEIRLEETNVETTDQFEKPVGGAYLLYTACYWRAGRVDPDEGDMACPTDVGFKVNGGPREQVDVSCECDHP